MSFILDALRKSETERQRQSGPGLVDAGYRPPARRRGLWLPLLVVVLGANLVLLAVLWLRHEPAPATTGSLAVAMPAPAASPPPALPATSATTPTAATADADFAAVADMPAVEPAPGAGVPEPAAAQATGEQRAAAPADAANFVKEDLPTAEQLAAEGSLPTPPLHLDIHVFGTTAAERFVFINTRRYTEGTQLTEGPRVEEITREGVVLSQNGRRFLLTRD